MARVDYDSQAKQYHAGRSASLDSLSGWRDALSGFLPLDERPILDVGAGTGIWMHAFATWFRRPVVGVEPSRGMRLVASSRKTDPATWLVAARAEAIPLGPGTCSMAWLSTVVHHLDDIRTCAVELRRVLAPGAPVFIRNSFPHRHDEVMLFRFFDAADRVADGFPDMATVESEFASAGFGTVDLQRVREPAPASLEAARQWYVAMRHTDSALAPLSDDEFADGLEKLDRAIADGQEPIPLGLDLLVLA
jgi:SAM-dependent methyltransferase